MDGQSKPITSASLSAEREWLENVYQKGARQLTLRAAISGMFLGAVMCLSNLYVVLKTGWSMGVTVTACILAYALFKGLKAARLAKTPLSVVENNAVGSVASAAGYMTGGGNMAALPALLMLTGTRPELFPLMAWFALIAALGVFAAIPIKRQLINVEQLAFPTGTATAETLQSLAAGGKSDKARYLGWAAVFGAVIAVARDLKVAAVAWNLPGHLAFPFKIAGVAAEKWTLSIESSSLLVGGGALMGFRVGWSLLLGACLTYGVLAPQLYAMGVLTTVSYKAIVQLTLWPGAAILVSSGLLSFAFQWRSVARSFSGLFARRARDSEDDPLADIECPTWWFVVGFVVLAPPLVLLMNALFAIPIWAGAVAIPLALAMGVVAARVTGETDTTPTKALGPVTQLIYGAMVPGNLPANIMGANVTGGVGLHAADLLTDLKSGYLVGANPRKQFFGQLLGVVAGALVVVPAFNLLVPTAETLGSAQFPAPSVQVWAGVSRVLVDGIGGLPFVARIGAIVGAAIGVVLVLVERYGPKRLVPYVPSPSGLGIAMVIPGSNALAMFAGAAMAELVRRRNPELADRAVVPVASGLIAGESLMGIAIAVLVAFGVLSK